MTGTTYSATVIQIDVIGRHLLSHIDQSVYFQALMYGRADRESYALPLGMFVYYRMVNVLLCLWVLQ